MSTAIPFLGLTAEGTLPNVLGYLWQRTSL